MCERISFEKIRELVNQLPDELFVDVRYGETSYRGIILNKLNDRITSMLLIDLDHNVCVLLEGARIYSTTSTIILDSWNMNRRFCSPGIDKVAYKLLARWKEELEKANACDFQAPPGLPKLKELQDKNIEFENLNKMEEPKMDEIKKVEKMHTELHIEQNGNSVVGRFEDNSISFLATLNTNNEIPSIHIVFDIGTPEWRMHEFGGCGVLDEISKPFNKTLLSKVFPDSINAVVFHHERQDNMKLLRELIFEWYYTERSKNVISDTHTNTVFRMYDFKGE